MFKFVTENSEHLRDALAVGAVVWLTWLVARHGSVWVWTKATSAWSSLTGDFAGVSTRLSTLEADVAWLKSYFEPVTPAPAPVVPAPVKPVVVATAPVVKPVPVAPVPAPAPVAPPPAPVVVAPAVVAPAPAPAPVAPVAPPAPAPVAPVPTLPPVKEPEAHIGHTGPERERKEPATVKPD